MKWRKAHRNRLRVLKRKPRRALFSPGWREWLDKVLPEMSRWKMAQNFIYEDSVFARIMRQESSGRPLSISGRRGRVPMVMIVDDDIDFSVAPSEPRSRGIMTDIDALRRAVQGEVVIDDLDDEPLNRRGSRMFWGDTFMVKIPDPLGLRDDSRRRQ